MINKVNRFFTKSVIIVLFLVLWEIAPRIQLVDPFVMPPLSQVLLALYTLIITGELFVNLAASLQRVFIGLLTALSIGIPLGIFMGWYSKVEEIADPLLQLFRNTPVTAMYPVFMLMFGLGETSKIAVIFWASVWASLLATIGGVKAIDPLLIKSARSMGISEFTLFKKVVLPASLPSVITGIRLSASSSIIILILAEMLGGSKGMGILIYNSQQLHKTPEMYSGIITMSLLGVIINKLLVLFEKNATRWKESK